jgi:hypothetical protein
LVLVLVLSVLCSDCKGNYMRVLDLMDTGAMGQVAQQSKLSPDALYFLKQAQANGINPIDAATLAHFESGMNPMQWNHAGSDNYGLIQFGAPERKKYGIVPGKTGFNEQVDAYFQFMKDRGFDPTKHSFLDMYSTINAGSPGNAGAVDSGSTVAQKVNSPRMQSSRKWAEKWLGGVDPQNPMVRTLYSGEDQATPHAPGVPPQALAFSSQNRQAPGGALGAIARALAGQAPQQQNAPMADQESFGSGLTRLGAALMARDNPAGAQALLSGIPARRQQKPVTWTDGGFEQLGDGHWVHMKRNDATGEVSSEPVDEGQVPVSSKLSLEVAQRKLQDMKDKAEAEPKLLRGTTQQFQQLEQALTAQKYNYDVGMKLIQEAADKGYDIGINAQGKAYLRGIANVSKDEDIFLKNVDAFIEKAVEDRANLEKGGLSDKRLAQAHRQYLPGGAQFASATKMDALKRVMDMTVEQHRALANSQNMLAVQYPQIGRQVRLGSGGKTYVEAIPAEVDELMKGQATYGELVKKYNAMKHTDGNPPQNASGKPPLISTPDELKNLKSGDVFMTPDGKLKRKP